MEWMLYILLTVTLLKWLVRNRLAGLIWDEDIIGNRDLSILRLAWSLFFFFVLAGVYCRYCVFGLIWLLLPLLGLLGVTTFSVF